MAVLHAKDYSYRQIGDLFHCDHKTVKAHIYQTEAFLKGDTTPLPVTDPDVYIRGGLAEHFILYTLMQDQSCHVRAIEKKMTQFPFAVARSTISRIIALLKLDYCDTIKRPLMTERHIHNRQFFATGLESDLRYMLPWFFTDECSIDLNPFRDGAYRIPGMQTQQIFQEYGKHPTRIMVWGGIAHGYKSPLIRIEGTLNAEGYRALLEQHGVIEDLDRMYGRGGWVFQDDGAPPHRAKATKEYLDQRCRNVAKGELAWPAQSPDLNPDENMWSLVKYGIDRENCPSPEELFARAQAVWNNIPQDVVDRIVDSFQDRLRAVQALHGESLNGHRDVLRAVRNGVTPEQIAAERDAENAQIQRFLHMSGEFFERCNVFNNPRREYSDHWLNQRQMESFRIVSHCLPSAIKTRTGITNRYPERVREAEPVRSRISFGTLMEANGLQRQLL
jgi:hypothetical protein